MLDNRTNDLDDIAGCFLSPKWSDTKGARHAIDGAAAVCSEQ